MNPHLKKIHKCHIEGCSAAFSRPYKLEFHLYKHQGERKFACDIEGCSKAYTTPSHLKRHKCKVHEKSSINTEILCKCCGLIYSSRGSFQKHFNEKHSNQFPFKCTECSKTFKKKRQLSEHTTIHTGELLYKCEICNNGFNKIYLLNKHKKNHKTYTCDCGETFSRWSSFCAHRKNICAIKVIDHTCIICNKTFTTKSNLKAHALTHVNESQQELFHCPFKDCSRSYQYKKNLNYHIKTYHEKTKSTFELNCTEPGCQVVLSTYVCLKRHYINVHKSKFKRKSARRTRCDKGKPKKTMTEILLGNYFSRDNLNTVMNSQENTYKCNQKNVCVSKVCSEPIINKTEIYLTDISDHCQELTHNDICDGDNAILSNCSLVDDGFSSQWSRENVTILEQPNDKPSREITVEKTSSIDDFDIVLFKECTETLQKLGKCIG